MAGLVNGSVYTADEYRRQLDYAIETRSSVRLDALGIYVNYHNLPAIVARDNMRRLMYGHDRITRFVCRYVLPRLFPNEYRWIADELARLSKLAEEQWVAEVLAQGERRLEEMNNAYNNLR